MDLLPSQYASPFLSLSLSNSLTCHFIQPKSLWFHWLFFSVELSSLGSLTLVEDPRRVSWLLKLFKRPLTHSFLTFHSCNVMLLVFHHPIFSIFLIIVVLLHWFWFLKFHWINKRNALEDHWNIYEYSGCCIHMRWYCDFGFLCVVGSRSLVRVFY